MTHGRPAQSLSVPMENRHGPDGLAERARRALRLAAALGCALGAAPAAAQDPAPAQPPAAPIAPADPAAAPGAEEEIVVTGSRIRRTNLEGVGPVSVVSSEQIALSGINTMDELLLELPSVGFQGIGRANNNGGGGLSFIDLRSLKPERTLVLIDGHRVPVSTSGIHDAVDMNSIPTALVERVELLRDGASALYGSDAVAGVVNFVLKDEFEGLEFDVLGGMTQEFDGRQGSVGVTAGRSFGPGRLLFNATWLDSDGIWQRDRGWARNELAGTNEAGQFLFGSATVPEGRIGSYFFRPDGDVPFQAFNGELPGLGHNFDYAKSQYLVSPINRASYNLHGSYEFSDRVSAYFQTAYTERDSSQRLAPTPIGNPGTPFAVPFNSLPLAFRQLALGDPNVPLPGVTNRGALNVDSTDPVSLIRRMVEAGDRIVQQDGGTLRFVAGLRGELPLSALGDWSWEAFGNYGRSEVSERAKGAINMERARQLALEGGGSRFAGGRLTADDVNFISYTERDRQMFHLKNVGLSTSGPLFELPAGAAQAAFGAEYRSEDGFSRPDPIKRAGNSSNPAADTTRGGFSTRELFWELELPLAKGQPLVDDLSVNLAGRFTDYSTFGSGYTYRYTASWAPSSELRVRAVSSTSFRAPSITQLFGGNADSFQILNDPCSELDAASDATLRANCAQQVPDGFAQDSRQLRTNVGGNPELDSEDSQMLGLGLVWTPEFMPEFSFTADYYRIDIENGISLTAPQFALDSCYRSQGLSDPSCAFITRGGPAASNQIELVDARYANQNKIQTKGIDAEIAYEFQMPFLGPVTVRGTGSYLLDLTERTPSGKRSLERSFTSAESSYPKFKANLATVFHPRDNVALSFNTRYISGGRSDADPPFDNAPNVWYLDSSVSYRFDETWSLVFGVRNLTDKKPPRLLDFANSNPNTYDYVGRYGYARMTARY
jgi:iron complex outermembrane receptor protein